MVARRLMPGVFAIWLVCAASAAGTVEAGAVEAGAVEAGAGAAGAVEAGPPPAGTPGAGTPGAASPPATAPRLPRDAITLRFRDAPIADVAAAVIGSALGRSFTVDPRVTGRVTLDLPNPVAPGAVLPLLDRALRTEGVRVVDRGAVVSIEPVGTAPAGTTGPGSGAARNVRRAPTTDRVPVRMVDPRALATVLRAMVPPSVSIATDETGRALVVGGTPEARQDVAELVSLLDADWMADKAFVLATLDNADPVTVAAELSEMFGAAGAPPAPDADPGRAPSAAGGMRFIPIERASGVLIVGRSKAEVARALRAVQSVLDRGNAVAGGRQLYIYPVENGRASDLARVLGGLFGAAETGGPSVLDQAPGLYDPTIDRSRSSGSGLAGSSALGRARDLGPAGPGASAGGPGRGRDQPMLSDLPARSSETGEPLQFGTERIRIVADERNNAVAVLASPQDWRMIEGFLQRLDVKPLQVFIEATVAEVTLSDDLSLGLQWFFSSGDFEFRLSDATTGLVNPRFPGFAGIFDNQDDVRVVLDALDEITNVRVVSSPQLVVLNNQTATLQVGNDVPVPTQNAVSVQDPNAPLVNTIEYRSTGVILRVTPRANANGTVTLDVEQEVSDVSDVLSATIDAPVIQQRRVESTVSVQSGETVAMGGLIQDSRTDGRRGLPVLSALPVIGPLFGTKTRVSDRTELLVLLTPRLLGSGADTRALTEELRRRMQGVAPLTVPGGTPNPDGFRRLR